jgi:pimeloyl-ACP methyl ester carboxylesterase
MKISFQRIITKDDLELHGILYEPDKKTNKAVIHVHAWNGNFYENNFIDFVARKLTDNGIAFLTFNNRGAGFVTDFIKRKKQFIEYVRIGGSLEKFEECIFDIDSVINFLLSKDYDSFYLEGHSTGCQKIAYYASLNKNKKIKALIFLSPADDIEVSKDLLKNRYEESLNIAREMVRQNKKLNPVPGWMAFFPQLSANTFLSIADPESLSGRIFDYSGNFKELKNSNLPKLFIFGSKDLYVKNVKKKSKVLKKEAENSIIQVIDRSDHWFSGFEDKLAATIENWIKNL